jgi:hypothetical protein
MTMPELNPKKPDQPIVVIQCLAWFDLGLLAESEQKPCHVRKKTRGNNTLSLQATLGIWRSAITING